MKIAIQLKNRSENISFDDIALQISWFRKDQNNVFQTMSEIVFPTATGRITYTFGEGMVLSREVFFLVLLKSTNILSQSSVPADKLGETESVVIEYDYSPVEFSEPDAPAISSKPLFVYGRLLEKKALQQNLWVDGGSLSLPS